MEPRSAKSTYGQKGGVRGGFQRVPETTNVTEKKEIDIDTMAPPRLNTFVHYNSKVTGEKE